MPSDVLVWVLLAAAAVIARWIVVRFPSCAPRTARGVAARVIAASACAPAVAPTFAALRGITGAAAALVLVAVPSGVALVLSLSWLLLWVGRPNHARSG